MMGWLTAFSRDKPSFIWEGFDLVGTKSIVIHLNSGEKFAKPELKSCIEEFEEKLNKFDIERKEQKLTAKNAQSHQQKVESLENITVTEKEEEEIGESQITVTTKTVLDPNSFSIGFSLTMESGHYNRHQFPITRPRAKVYGSDLGLC
ncbi:hypothetical protein R3W88_014636 [Solanum pinnatisectum]|uniref:FACT complex subunit n=1 Tax=Solanum pinnatisectum TaxID=50273 RepID=A0AAV9KT10_9SOLN|nr:hypothetical protein R3W88_014636 [Solanum pinnatisectum]